MRTIILDAHEGGADTHLTLSVATRAQFASVDEFFFATMQTGAFARDERWYAKQAADGQELRALLETVTRDVSAVRDEILGSCGKGFVLCNAWDEIDFACSTEVGFVRISWVCTG